jgi:hypothetical protein
MAASVAERPAGPAGAGQPTGDSAAFRAVPELVKALERLGPEEFPKIMAYLNNPVSRRIRTNNHVERTNRMIRFLEKVRYK